MIISQPLEKGDTLYFEGDVTMELLEKAFPFLLVFSVEEGVFYCELTQNIGEGRLEQITNFLQERNIHGGSLSPEDYSKRPFIVSNSSQQ